MPRAAFIGDESLWQGGHPPGHPLRPQRLQDTWEMLHAYGAFSAPGIQVVPPRMPTEEELATFHSRDYIETVRRLSRGEVEGAARYNFGPGDNPVFRGMYESEGLKVGAALVAADQLLQGKAEVAFSFSGGLHHAGPTFACGFCVFGDSAVAIHRLLAAGQRVAYIDIDAHHGDGVQAAFYTDPRVLTISFHESGEFLFPGTGFPDELGQGDGYGYSINVPLLPHTGDTTILWAFDRIVPPLLDRFAPDILVAQFGVDAHWRDPLTHLALTTHGLEALFRRIYRLAPRLLAVGGGGYDPTVVPRAWTLAWGVLSCQAFPDELPDSVANRYEPAWLHDRDRPAVTDAQQRRAQSAAERVVARLQEALSLD